jgi:hypothetical protein
MGVQENDVRSTHFEFADESVNLQGICTTDENGPARFGGKANAEHTFHTGLSFDS